MTTLIDIEDVKRHYQSGDTTVRALDGISLKIGAGEFVAIMGQSGSGKSTLMNILGCLDRPTGGRYRIAGVEVAGLDGDGLAALRRRTFGFVFQRYNLLATATAEENVSIPGLYEGLSRPVRQERARELLGRLGLGDRADHRPSQLSGGQQQRVAIARALMNDPPVILADEPTGALDSRSGEEVMNLLRKLHSEGRTIILITHDENVAAHAHRIIRLHDGRITEDSGAKAQNTTAAIEAKGNGAGIWTDISESFVTALRALRVNIFRTALTLLGIIIGVAAVVTMMAVGNGSKQKVLDQISAMGTNVLSIRPGIAGFRGSGDIATLVPSDAEEIAKLANIEAVVPERSGRSTLRSGNLDYATSVSGVGVSMPVVRDWPVGKGTFFNERDVTNGATVIVIGKTVADTLFPYEEDPIGKYVLVSNIPFEVIGVLAVKGATPWGSDQDDAAYIPYTTGITRLFGQNYLNNITVKVTELSGIDATQSEITQLLISRHKTEDFMIRNTASIMEMATETQNTLTILLGAVAAISLLVGGIGVMNIMLVSVTERTREIGIRMATGARMRDIMLQFNIEAAVVCIIGGLMGLALGYAAGIGVSMFEVSVVFSAMPAILAFSSAVLTGILFGYLPARKAARLDPVVALATE